MTQLSRDDLVKLATLSGFVLDDDEITNRQADIQKILEYVDQLGELDTEGVEPTYMVVDKQNVWRDDEVVQDSVSREELLALAPATDKQQVKVPKVL